MAQHRIVCITKLGGHYNPHERITHVKLATGSIHTQEQVIVWIENDQHQFFVARPGRSVWVVVASRNGRKYLKTEADGAEPNNLLALPEC